MRIAERQGLESWIWALINGPHVRESPWSIFDPQRDKPRLRDYLPTAACIAFIWYRIKPSGFKDTCVKSAVDLLLETQLNSGGWPIFSDDTKPSLLATATAIHALSLAKPTGWQRFALKGAQWLWQEQHSFGYWDIQGGPTVLLTVLTLDAIALAELKPVTFGRSIVERTVKTKLSKQEPDIEYVYDGIEWHNPPPPSLKTVAIKFNKKPPQAVLMCATSIELRQILRVLRPLPNERKILKLHSDSETYYLGRFGAFIVAVFKSTMGSGGPAGATLAAAAALKLWAPKALIMMGICFGANKRKQGPGDVTVADQIIPYENQRVAKKPIFKNPIPATGSTLRNRFDNAIGWEFYRPDGTKVQVQVGPMLSGDKLIDDPVFKRKLLEQYPSALAGEMEGAGVWAAAAREKTEWILVKGVCDWGDGQKHDGFQELAAASAVSLCEYVLSDKTALHGL